MLLTAGVCRHHTDTVARVIVPVFTGATYRVDGRGSVDGIRHFTCFNKVERYEAYCPKCQESETLHVC